MGINYPVLVDDGKVSAIYGPIRSIPTTFIIDKLGQSAGRIQIHQHRGQVAIVDAKHTVPFLGKANQTANLQERIGIVNFNQHRHRQLGGGYH